VFRRLSILVRRASDDRATFARGWERHGTIVKHLPGIRSYQQNHVVEEFGHTGQPPPFRVDGIVELRFDSPEAMKEAFASEAAMPVKADEPHFLGHGTGYAMAVAHTVRTAEDGSKLIVILRHEGHGGDADALEALARSLPGFVHAIRDNVVTVIARPEMREGPQQADVFLHVYFDSVDRAREAARQFVQYDTASAAFSTVRVRTLTVI
jgi:uncharacterized protein (TIGR02118 family)